MKFKFDEEDTKKLVLNELEEKKGCYVKCMQYPNCKTSLKRTCLFSNSLVKPNETCNYRHKNIKVKIITKKEFDKIAYEDDEEDD